MLRRYLMFITLTLSSLESWAGPPTFLPSHGKASTPTSQGTIVTVSGTGFTNAIRVDLNGTSVGNRVANLDAATSGFEVLNDSTLRFVTPVGGLTGKVSVSLPSRVDRSVNNFVVAPRITSYAPLSSTSSGIVTVSGANLLDVRTVLLNGVSVGPKVSDISVSASGFQVVHRAQLKFRVPDSGTSGKIQLVNSADDATESAKSLVVRPAILSFAPTHGTETVKSTRGSVVVLKGTTFSDVTVVKLNGLSVGPRVSDLQAVSRGFQVISDKEIIALVPANATSGKWIVSSSAGNAVSAATFTVDPRISAVFPQFGITGTPIVVTGTNLAAVSSIMLGDVPVGNAFQVVSNSEIRLSVPAGSRTGRVIVTGLSGSSAISPSDFEVVNTLIGFSPASGLARSAGSPGTIISIQGSGFLRATEVLFGGITAGPPVTDLAVARTGFQIISDTEVLARVPATAKTAPLSVRFSRPFSPQDTSSGYLGISQSAFIVSPGSRSLSLPAFFNDSMVLQRGVQIPIWGKSRPGDQVTVNFAGQEKVSVANEVGEWKVILDSVPATQSSSLSISNGYESVALTNVAVGDVWICAGQSNMSFPVRRTPNASETVSQAEDSGLRVFTVGRAAATEVQRNISGEWYSIENSNAGEVSAVAYFFGRELRRELGVPVGLIVAAVGGTPAEAWTSSQTLQSDPILSPILSRWTARIATTPSEAFSYNRPGVLFNGMVAPLAPFAVSGVVWYQGEANVLRSYQYKSLLPSMIADWRRLWAAEDPGSFPFHLVQIANYGTLDVQPGNSDRAELREAQQQTSIQPGNSLAVTIDIGEASDIHPVNKLDVAKRVSHSVLAKTYGRAIESSGPSFSTMQIEGNTLRLSFTSATGLKTTHSDPDSIPAFAIAGADRRWMWAQVQIDGEEIIVSHPSISQPVAARYGWSSNPQATIYNGSNLPMVPFRTDLWPGVTDLVR